MSKKTEKILACILIVIDILLICLVATSCASYYEGVDFQNDMKRSVVEADIVACHYIDSVDGERYRAFVTVEYNGIRNNISVYNDDKDELERMCSETTIPVVLTELIDTRSGGVLSRWVTWFDSE